MARRGKRRKQRGAGRGLAAFRALRYSNNDGALDCLPPSPLVNHIYVSGLAAMWRSVFSNSPSYTSEAVNPPEQVLQKTPTPLVPQAKIFFPEKY